MYRCLTILISILLFTGIPGNGAFWDVEVVYDGGFASGDTSLAIDGGNIPAISYTANGDLHVASRILGGWASEFVLEVGFWGGFSSLAFNASGQQCIAFIDATDLWTNYLKFARKTAGGWVVETVDEVGWLSDSVYLAFDPTGHACIAYAKTTGSYPNMVTYASFARRSESGTWSTQNIAPIASISAMSLVINGGGKAYITYADPGSGQLRLAESANYASWTMQTVDGDAALPVVWRTSITVQPNGEPAVAYFQNVPGATLLKLARKSGTWRKETIQSLATGGVYHCAAAITQGGIPMVAYHEPAEEKLAFAWKSGGRWLTQIADIAYQSGLNLSLKVDGLGNAHLSYFEGSTGNVKFAWAIEPISIGSARGALDNEIVHISGIATTAEGELGNRIYVQAFDRSAGIQLYLPELLPVERGMVLDVQGAMATIDGERAIDDPGLVELGNLPEPRPLFMISRNVGGGTGLSNLGLLVRTSGRVKSVGGDYFTIDDGSGVMLKCLAAGISLPSPDSYVLVKGISSTEPAGRVLRVRDTADIQ